MNAFTIDFNEETKHPLYEQLYSYLANEIKLGHLKENEKLPSKKALMSHLHISQNTIETAYSMLVQEGYIRSVPRSGFFVCKLDTLISASNSTAIPSQVKTEEPPQIKKYKYDFKTNAVDITSFPYATWARLSKDILCRYRDLLSIGDNKGDLVLRTEIAKYLHEFRGVRCDAKQIIIGAGIEYLLMLLHALLNQQAAFAVENPGYGKAAAILKNNGRKLHYIPLDSSGMCPDGLKHSGADIAYITPSYQFPTGIVMPIGRRIEFLKWANEKDGRYIIEDDYNSEFNFIGKPIPSIQGLDTHDKVIYLSTFSRILAPSIRIAYMVLPNDLLAEFEDRFRSYSSTVSRFDQHTLASFIRGGYLSRHLNRVKNIYRKRRDTLMTLLKQIPDISVSGENAGLHLLVKMKNFNRERFLNHAERHSVKIYFLSDYYLLEPDFMKDAIILGYAGLTCEEIKNAFCILFS